MMIFHAVRSDGVYVEFQGMTQDQIVTMLSEQGYTCQFLDFQDWESAVLEKSEKEPQIDKDKEKNDWMIAKNNSQDEAIQFLAKKLGLE